MNSRVLKFELNEPVTIALATLQYLETFNDWGKPQLLFQLADQRRMYAEEKLATKILALGVRALESFCIRKWKKGRNVNYDVWLSNESEKKRAIEETPAIADQLRQPTPAEMLVLAPTGTETARVPQILPLAPPANRRTVEAIPFNIAFREVLAFIATELREIGQEWGDQARQDMASTVLIAAVNKGWVGPWERKGL